MFGQNDNGQPSDNNTDFSQAANDLTSNNGQATPPAWGHPGDPMPDNNAGGSPAPDSQASPMPQEPTSINPVPTPPSDDQPQDNPAGQPVPIDPAAVNALIDLKQQALGQLSPLVEHLDQNNEEKFNTIMMMIQASDDQSLIQSAFESAQKIVDDKARAQALLDIINEINYFTQQTGPAN